MARAAEAYFYPLNDFFFFIAIVLILSLSDCDSKHRNKSAPAWQREVLVLQLAWIYFATAVMKLGPSFISGGDLYVRQNYLASFLNWPYPTWYRSFVATLFGNSILSWTAITLELTLSAVLFAWVFDFGRRRTFRLFAVLLVVAIHGFAALTTNVFFFGANMIAAVVLLTHVTQAAGSSRGGRPAPSDAGARA